MNTTSINLTELLSVFFRLGMGPYAEERLTAVVETIDGKFTGIMSAAEIGYEFIVTATATGEIVKVAKVITEKGEGFWNADVCYDGYVLQVQERWDGAGITEVKHLVIPCGCEPADARLVWGFKCNEIDKTSVFGRSEQSMVTSYYVETPHHPELGHCFKLNVGEETHAIITGGSFGLKYDFVTYNETLSFTK